MRAQEFCNHLSNYTKKILLGLFASVDLSLIFKLKFPEDHAELRAPICQNQTSFPHALSLKRTR